MLHGFTGNPQSMRGLALALADAGFTVEMPLLPGHGTDISDMLPTRWKDWSEAAETAYDELAARSDSVVVVGLSMGGMLSVWLAQRHPEIAAIVVVNPLIAPPDADTLTLVESMIENGDEVAPGIGSDIAMEGAVESAYPGLPLRAALSLFAAASEVGSRRRVRDVPGSRVHERAGPCGRSEIERDPRRARQGPGRAGDARTQLPRGHAGL